MIKVNLQGFTESLIQTTTELGVDISVIKAHETVERIRFSIDRFEVKRLSKKTPKELKTILLSLVKDFGLALSMQFIIGSKTILKLSSTISDEEITKLLGKVREGVKPRLDFDLNKSMLLKGLFPPENYPNIVARFFFFPDALQNALSIPLTRLETKDGLWHEVDDQHRLVIIIPDREIKLVGEYLIIIGGKNLEQLPTFLSLPKPSDNELVQRMRDQALDPLSPVKWVYFKLKFLTPPHLHVKGDAQSDDNIAQTLYTQLINLCLIYCADRTKGPAEDDLDKDGYAAEWRSTFIEESHAFDVVWTGSTKIPKLNTKQWSDPLAWSDIISFAFADKIYSFDKLKIIQLAVAHNLESVKLESSYKEVVSRAQKIREYAYLSWENFIEGKIKEYFAQLRDVESAVESVTEKFVEHVDALTKTVFDNALAAVGVLIGTFIAAAFHDKFNPWLFWVGIIVYLVYLMIFPNWLGLGFMRERFDKTVVAFEKRREDFKSRLNPTVVESIVGKVVSEWTNIFNTWFRRAKIIYRFVAVFLIFIAIVVTFVTSAGLIGTTISPTDTPSLIPTQIISETNTPAPIPMTAATP